MANQPTKYRKFVVGAASAALVASAVAPVAFAAEFTDVKDNNSHKAAIDALSDAGVISGYPDGTFQPNKTLTRSDVVKLMGKWLVAEGYKVPTDYKTKPRFSDLKTTSNDELLKMSALVYDNGVFVGKPDGSLDAAGDITRENMAIVLVRAFDRVYDVDLVSYVKGQTDFNKDVTDLGKAKAEARPAIDVLDFFDITNPAAPEFNPKNTTTRGQFASFLYKTTKVDFDQIGGEVVAPGVASVKAVNATTVEVTMKDKVTNIDSLKFTIDGLTVSNAAVKQSDDKTVVLTTAVQKGAEKYTVKLNDKAIGNFVGISNVVPDKISLNTKSVQGVVGQQVILSADIGVKEAGVAVTFNVKANTTGTLNKDQVFEAVTNADGIATFSYTQYNAGNDTVTVYPTGNAAVREQGMVYWESAAQLTIKDITEATTLANGSKKVYEINSARNANGYVFVTFKENLNVTPDKLVKTITAEGVTTHTVDSITGKPGAALAPGAYPYKASTSGENVIAVKLDASGKANLVLTGANATATPIVYEGDLTAGADKAVATNYNAKYSATARQAMATPVTFEVKQSLGLTINAEGVQNAATYKNSTQTGGRNYALTFNTKDGKPATPGTKVNVLIDTENLTGTLHVLDSANKEVAYTSYENGKKRVYAVEVGKDGKAMFTVSSDKENDFVTPVAFIDNGKTTGQLDTDDLQATGEITYFVEKVNYTANLKAVDKDGKKVSTVIANGAEPAGFVYELVDQNGKPRSSTDATTVSFEVQAGTGAVSVGSTVIPAGTTKTVPAVIAAGATEAKINVVAASPTTATVTATGSKAGVVLPTTNPASVSVNFSQYGSAAVTGVVSNINPALEVLTINNTVYSYANAAAYQIKGSAVTKTAFVNEVAAGSKTVSVTVGSDGKFTFNVVDASTGTPGTGGSSASVATQVNNATTETEIKTIVAANYPELTDTQADDFAAALFNITDNGGTVTAANLQSTYNTTFVTVKSAEAVDTDNDGVADQIKITFSESTTASAIDGLLATNFTLSSGATLAGTASNGATLTYNVEDANSADLGTLNVKGSDTDVSVATTKSLASGKVKVTPAANTLAGGVTGTNNKTAAGGPAVASKVVITPTAATAGGNIDLAFKADDVNNGTAVLVSIPVVNAESETNIGAQLKAALPTSITDKYTVTVDSATGALTFTSKIPGEVTKAPVATITGVVTTPINGTGTVGSNATAEVNTITFSNNVTSNGVVKLVVNGTTVETAVAKNDTPNTVANKVYDKLRATTAITDTHTVSIDGANVILTNKTNGAQTTVINVTP